MRKEQIEALKLYFEAINRLKDESVIRSDSVTGDIGEFLCKQVYEELELVKRKNNPHFDAFLNGEVVQIKFSDSTYTENISLGNPDKYKRLIVVLGKNSKHRKIGSPDDDFLFYGYTSEEVKEHFAISNAYTLAKGKHFKDHEFSLNLKYITKPSM